MRAAAENRYDAILMDFHIPEINVYEAPAAIRANEGTEEDLRSPLTSHPTSDVLDCSVIADLRSLAHSAGEDFVGDLAALYLADASARITDLHDAVEAGDAPGAFAAAHTLAGSSANLGATDLAALCAALADVFRYGELYGASFTLDLIDREFDRVEPAVRALIGSR